VVARVKDKSSLSLFRRHLEGFIEGMIREDDFQVGGKHDKRFTYCLYDALIPIRFLWLTLLAALSFESELV